MNDKQIKALANKLSKKSKVKYDRVQLEREFIPDCMWCKSRRDNERNCEDCVKDLRSEKCRFKAVSKEFKKLSTLAMLGKNFIRN
jgi:hypothetical protein